jgi:Zn-dependent alcohol dehydrogenase
MTNGNGADKTIVTAGIVTEEIVTHAFDNTGKGGTIVLIGLNKLAVQNIHLPGSILTLWKKTVKGSLFGDCNPTTDIPKILGLYQSGDLKLDELITRTYTLDQVNEGYDDLLDGKNVRGVLIHEH